MQFREEDLLAAKERLAGFIDGRKITGTGVGIGKDGKPCIHVFAGKDANKDTLDAIRQSLSGIPIEVVEPAKFKAL